MSEISARPKQKLKIGQDVIYMVFQNLQCLKDCTLRIKIDSFDLLKVS